MIRRLFILIGRRGAFLLFLWMLDWIYAFSLFYPTKSSLASPMVILITSIRPLSYWATMWMFVGAMALVYAFRREDQVGYAAVMFLKTLWAAIFLFGWIFGDIERGYLAAAIWGAFAALLGLIATWPEADGIKVT